MRVTQYTKSNDSSIHFARLSSSRATATTTTPRGRTRPSGSSTSRRPSGTPTSTSTWPRSCPTLWRTFSSRPSGISDDYDNPSSQKAQCQMKNIILPAHCHMGYFLIQSNITESRCEGSICIHLGALAFSIKRFNTIVRVLYMWGTRRTRFYVFVIKGFWNTKLCL